MRIRSTVLAGHALLALTAAGEDLVSAAEQCRTGKAKACETILKAARNKDAGKRLQAARVLTDPVALADLARNDSSTLVRQAAVENEHLTDPAVLAALALEGGTPAIRKSALARVGDPAVLAQAAQGDRESEVRQAARVPELGAPQAGRRREGLLRGQSPCPPGQMGARRRAGALLRAVAPRSRHETFRP